MLSKESDEPKTVFPDEARTKAIGLLKKVTDPDSRKGFEVVLKPDEVRDGKAYRPLLDAYVGVLQQLEALRIELENYEAAQKTNK